MTSTIVVSPAYGRDYMNKRDAIAAWNAGLDFICQSFHVGGTYITRQEAKETGATHIQIRYCRMQRVMVIKNI